MSYYIILFMCLTSAHIYAHVITCTHTHAAVSVSYSCFPCGNPLLLSSAITQWDHSTLSVRGFCHRAAKYICVAAEVGENVHRPLPCYPGGWCEEASERTGEMYGSALSVVTHLNVYCVGYIHLYRYSNFCILIVDLLQLL